MNIKNTSSLHVMCIYVNEDCVRVDMYISESGLDKELLDKPSMRKHLLHIEELVHILSLSSPLFCTNDTGTNDPRHEWTRHEWSRHEWSRHEWSRYEWSPSFVVDFIIGSFLPMSISWEADVYWTNYFLKNSGLDTEPLQCYFKTSNLFITKTGTILSKIPRTHYRYVK